MTSGETGPCVVFAGRNLEPWLCKNLAWENGQITGLDKVEPVLKNPGLPVLIPGLVNGHTHFGDSIIPDGSAGLSLQEAFFRPEGLKYRRLKATNREDHILTLEKNCREFARCGGVAHLDFREQGLEGVRRLRRAAGSVGITSVILSQFADLPFSAEALEMNKAELSPESLSELEAFLAEADGFSESTMNDLTDPAWKTIGDIVARRGKLKAIHCLEDETYRSLSLARTGRGDLSRALDLYRPDLIVHVTVADSEEIALLAKSGVRVALNPRANALLGLPMPPIAELMEAGICLLLGTDNVMLNHPNLLPEMDMAFRLARSQRRDANWPDPLEILKMVTVNAAPLVPDYSGCLEVHEPVSWVKLDGAADGWRESCHLPAALLGRVGSGDILETRHKGRIIYDRITG